MFGEDDPSDYNPFYVKKLEEKLNIAIKALEFYTPIESYVSGEHEYCRPTSFNAGRDPRFINRVGLYGTTAKEALEKIK